MTDPIPGALAALLVLLAPAATGARGCLTRVPAPGSTRPAPAGARQAAGPREAAAAGPHTAPPVTGRTARGRSGPPNRPESRHSAPAEPPAAGRTARPGTGDPRRPRPERTAHGKPEGVRAPGRGRPLRAALAVAAGAAALLLGTGSPAVAHPLGNFSVNRYDGLVVAERELRVDHVEDLAEIPTARIRPREMAPAELAAWAEERCGAAAGAARLLVDGRTVPLETGSARAEVRPGQAGLPTLRVECALRAPLPGGEADLVFTAAPGEGAGWREITARADRTTLAASDVPGESVSRGLSAYPQRLLESPPAHTAARLTVAPGGPALDGAAAAAAPPSVLPRGVDRWTQALTGLVERRDLTVPFGALALLVALVLGALHALAPGHGKTLMAAAAAAGGRSSLREVLALGASVTVTHTLGVFALGALIVAGSAVTPAVVGWLGMASGILVAVAGALLARRAWQDRAHGRGHTHVHWLGGGRFRTYTHTHTHTNSRGDGAGDGHDQGEDRGHDAARARDAAQVHGHGHGHEHEQTHEHGHGHGHGDEHGHGRGHGHKPGPGHHQHRHEHHHEHEHEHRRTGREHPAAGDRHPLDHGSQGQRPLRRSILLGLAGGLVPSPSAVVVLVGAAALGHAWFGLLLVVAYGAGLALTLTAAGFAVVRLGGRIAARLARRRTAGRLAGLVQRSAPIGTALTVVLLGCGLALRGAAGAMG